MGEIQSFECKFCEVKFTHLKDLLEHEIIDHVKEWLGKEND